MIIDLHCHYTFTALAPDASPRFAFETPGANDPTAYDSCVSPRSLGRASWQAMRRALRLPPPGPALDAHLADFYAEHLAADGPVDRCVLLAFDAYHDDEGRRPPLPRRPRDVGNDIYTSNSLVRSACIARPDHYLFGASIHPYRRDALAAVDEVFGAGACLLKLIPLHQNVDMRDARTIALLRRCAELGLPVLLHFGPEFTLRTNCAAHGELPPLLQTLRELRRTGAMPTTIIAHVATPVMPWGPWRHYRTLLDALTGEFADAPLYADISALLSWGKVWSLRTLARRQDLHAKLLFGSDFPVVMATAWLHWRFWRAWPRLSASGAAPQRYCRIFREAGFGEIIHRRAARLLPNIDFFRSGASATA